MTLNYWRVKKLQRKRKLEYSIRTKFIFLNKILKEEDIDAVIKIVLLLDKCLKILSPLFICAIIFVAMKAKIPIILISALYFVVLFASSMDLIENDNTIFEIKCLFPAISSRLSLANRIKKLFLPIILSPILLHHVVYLLFFMTQIDNYSLGVFGITILLCNFVCQFLIYRHRNKILKIDVKKTKADVHIKENHRNRKEVKSILTTPIESFFEFYKIKLKMYIGLFIYSVTLCWLVLLFRDLSLSENIVVLYYYSILPSFYNMCIKSVLSKSLFFDRSLLPNYYFMKKFAARTIFIKTFAKFLNKITCFPILIFSIPIIFFDASYNSCLIIILYFCVLISINFINIFQKTGNLKIPIEMIDENYSDLLDIIEDFFLVGSGVYLNSVVMGLYLKNSNSLYLEVYLVGYGLVLICYTILKGGGVYVKNKKRDKKI